MANPFQQKSLRRKVSYLVAIGVLFFVSLLHRQFVVEPTSYNLQLRAVAQGQAELTSSAIRLALLGSRGLATCVLWQMALERQTHHQWNQLELLVKSITTLQPNFVSPWLFQSWNLAFNVAVECDRPRDKYFYVTRGMQLLAEGERRHQGTARHSQLASDDRPRFPGNPDMRYYMAVYYLRKIGLSDEQNAMRSLFDLSCIDPKERQPERFRELDTPGRQVINLKEFQKFCDQNPRLVRRLKLRLRCTRPEDVIGYLERNQGVPSRFKEADVNVVGATETPLLDPEEQFPSLPPPNDKLIPNRSERTFADNFDVFTAARAWYVYAQEPLPPPDASLEDDLRTVDALRYRLPKMSTFLFRSFPGRGQEYVAENMQAEGWFDNEGWNISKWFEDAAVESEEVVVVVGQKSKFDSKRAWDLAHDMYKKYGHDNGLLLPEGKFERLQKDSALYTNSRLFQEANKRVDTPIELVRQQGGEALVKSFRAYNALMNYYYERRTANFDGHFNQCKVERLPLTVIARKQFFQADEQQQDEAIPASVVEKAYKEALDLWFLILVGEPDYRNLDNIQTETYEKEQTYLGMIEERDEKKLKVLIPFLAQVAMAQPGHDPRLTTFLALVPQDDNVQSWLRSRALPLRRVSGFMESVYFFRPPSGEENQTYVHGALEDYLLVVTQPPGVVPFALTNLQKEWQLAVITTANRDLINTNEWDALLPEATIRSVGSFSRIYRFLTRHPRDASNQS